MGIKTLFSFSISWRLSRGQLWIADTMLRTRTSFILLLDLAIFKVPVLFFLFLLAWLIKTILLIVQRLNDLNVNQRRLLARLWIVIFCLLVNHLITWIILIICFIALQIYLYAIRGELGANEYGTDPIKIQPGSNEKYVVIVWFFLVLLLCMWAIVVFLKWGVAWLFGGE